MYFTYGNKVHAANEVTLSNITKRKKYNKKGYADTLVVTWTIEGVLLASTQAAIKAAILSFEQAYSSDYYSAALYHDDGTISAHVLPNSTSTTGVKVLSLSWPNGDGAEYATGRTFRVVLEAEYALDIGADDDGNTEYRETLRITGTGGPRTVILETLTGPPVKQITNKRTKVTAVQSGTAVGKSTWPAANTPIFPPHENVDRRDISYASPKINGEQREDYATSWTYYFESIGPLNGRPKVR